MRANRIRWCWRTRRGDQRKQGDCCDSNPCEIGFLMEIPLQIYAFEYRAITCAGLDAEFFEQCVELAFCSERFGWSGSNVVSAAHFVDDMAAVGLKVDYIGR